MEQAEIERIKNMLDAPWISLSGKALIRAELAKKKNQPKPEWKDPLPIIAPVRQMPKARVIKKPRKKRRSNAEIKKANTEKKEQLDKLREERKRLEALRKERIMKNILEKRMQKAQRLAEIQERSRKVREAMMKKNPPKTKFLPRESSFVPDQPKKQLVRPPAQYSNPQWEDVVNSYLTD